TGAALAGPAAAAGHRGQVRAQGAHGHLQAGRRVQGAALVRGLLCAGRIHAEHWSAPGSAAPAGAEGWRVRTLFYRGFAAVLEHLRGTAASAGTAHLQWRLSTPDPKPR